MQQTIPLPPDQQFDPELVRSMSLAYGNVCRVRVSVIPGRDFGKSRTRISVITGQRFR
jgi:hypothetical protein